MKKLKNKNGFIAMSLIYSFFLLFIAIMVALLVNLSHTKILLSRINKDIKNTLEGNYIHNYPYNSGTTYYTFEATETGTYKIELWGANGAYTKGEINLSIGNKLYIYVGASTTTNVGGYNGGGTALLNSASKSGIGGGGSTDVRLTNGTWNNATSLNSRIMIAAGRGGTSSAGGQAGGLIGYDGYDATYQQYQGKGATQTTGGLLATQYSGCTYSASTIGTFGIGGNGGANSSSYSGGGSGGGSGYYGGSGASGSCGYTWYGGGGSSYISGHTGCVAITSASDQTPKIGCSTGTDANSCSIHYSTKVFTKTIMIDGKGYGWTNTIGSLTPMPNPTGGYYALGIAHSGDGYARITYLK